MTSDPKTKPEVQEAVSDETADDPKSRELTLEELASVSGSGENDNGGVIFGGSSQGPDWNTDG